MDTSVGLVGAGRAATAIDAALGDEGLDAQRIDPGAADAVDYVVAVGPVGDNLFGRVHATGATWLALELGGIGGYPHPDVPAGISILGGDAGCFRCLRQRVSANDESVTETAPGGDVPARTERLAGAIAGHRLLEWIGGEAVPGDVMEVPHATRRLLPVPDCPCNADRDRSVRREHTAVDLVTAVDRAEVAIDPRVGIVTAIGEAHSFPAPYYLATLADASGFSDAEVGQHAAGVSGDWNAAYMKAAGEALERYAAGVYRTDDFERAPPTDLSNPVPPSAFVLPDDGYEAPDSGTSIPWVPGEDLDTGERVHLPAEFVQYPPPERRYKPAITTGLGLGTSGVGALLSGLYEVIERDATMLAWYSTFEPIGLDVDSERFATLSRHARAEDLSVTPLLVTGDVDVPVASVAVHREGAWPQFAVGSAADLDPAAAAENALCEALQNWMELRGLGREGAREEETSIDRYADFPREAREFAAVEGEVPAASVGPEEPLGGEAELDALLERVANAGLSTYAARLTTPDLEALGFEAVRVLVPGAQPLFTGDRFFGERARTVPRDLGYRPRFDRPPHPYP